MCLLCGIESADQGHTLRLEYAGLARGEDPTLDGALAQLAQRHGDALESAFRARVD